MIRTRLQVICIYAMSAAASVAQSPDRLADLVARALTSNPTVAAARRRVERALAEHESTGGFLDPRFTARAGYSRTGRSVPGSTLRQAVAGDSFEVSAGVEYPVSPGMYLGVGMAERYLVDPPGGHEGAFQTLLGAQVRIPLLRDRRFSEWSLERARAMAEYSGAISRLELETETVRHGVELGYVAVLEAATKLHVAKEATGRFRTLLDGAEKLAASEAIPEYQVHPARMELELHRETELAAEEALESDQIELSRLIGDGHELGFTPTIEMLLTSADKVELPPVAPERAHESRGDFRELSDRITVAELELRLAEEHMKTDLSLGAGVTWQGEDDSWPAGGGRISSDRHLGTEASILWTCPLGFTEEENVVKAREQELAALHELKRRIELDAAAAISSARLRFESARKRLAIVAGAVTDARKTLEAEINRFQLGEGRSRYVLDAQKDVTRVVQRQATIAAALLRAGSNYGYACGYPAADDDRAEE